MMFKECSSGVRNPNFGEMKGRHLTLAKRQLFKNELHGQLLKAPKARSMTRSACLYDCLLPKVKHLCFKAPKLGTPTPLDQSLNIINCQNWGKNCLPKHELVRDLKNNSITSQKLHIGLIQQRIFTSKAGSSGKPECLSL